MSIIKTTQSLIVRPFYSLGKANVILIGTTLSLCSCQTELCQAFTRHCAKTSVFKGLQPFQLGLVIAYVN